MLWESYLTRSAEVHSLPRLSHDINELVLIRKFEFSDGNELEEDSDFFS